jgi:hypothetical protein
MNAHDMNESEKKVVEQTKLCAQAMGLSVYVVSDHTLEHTVRLEHQSDPVNQKQYFPQEIDVQAMALAKRYMLQIDFFVGSARLPVNLYAQIGDCASFSDESINYAIVECVAKMQERKNKANDADEIGDENTAECVKVPVGAAALRSLLFALRNNSELPYLLEEILYLSSDKACSLNPISILSGQFNAAVKEHALCMEAV